MSLLRHSDFGVVPVSCEIYLSDELAWTLSNNIIQTDAVLWDFINVSAEQNLRLSSSPFTHKDRISLIVPLIPLNSNLQLFLM